MPTDNEIADFPHVVQDEKTGKNTVRPGYYPDLSDDYYHGGPGISSSNVKVVVNKSPFHLWDQKINPKRQEEEVEEYKPGGKMNAKDFGHAYHTIILEPVKFSRQYIQLPEMPHGITTRMNAGKAFIKDFADSHEGKRVICEEDMNMLKTMAASVRNHPKAAKILEIGKGIIESSFFHIDKETGLLLKIRPDYMRRGIYIADLKSTVDASYDYFSRHLFTFGYHISSAMYLDVFKAETGEDYQGKFILVCQEKERPHAIANYVISDEAIAFGRDQYRKALIQIAECVNKYGSDPWESYPPDIQQIDIPNWAYRKA